MQKAKFNRLSSSQKTSVSNRKAFTLVEVMIASMLISILGLSLLQMHANSSEMSHTMQQKFSHSDWVLMSAFEKKVERTKQRVKLDTLMKPFNIDNREIRQTLRQEAVITTRLIERIDAQSIKKQMEETSDLDLQISDAFRLEIYEQHIDLAGQTHSLYRLVKP